MPFTPAHAAAVLPFLRTSLPASALVAGSVAPDLPFYLPGSPSLPTHTAWAVVTLDVLLAAAAWALWHGLLAAPALAAAPRGLRGRLAGVPLGVRVRLRSPAAVGRSLLALALGAATHVLLDEFTHPGRWGSELVPGLADTWGLLPGYRWLQYAGSVLGCAILLGWLVRWWLRTPATTVPARPARWWPWVLLVTGGVVPGGLAALAAPGIGSAVYGAATWGGGTAALVAVALATAWQVRAARRGAT
ncbi:DUF4184 family protein [Blastococcus tunisiensis]|uniref:DUF4184 family protein n=1 Tax=Blastococcus tunisiensis TaxID=1798228 RepID=A0A1I2K2N3_9ACTN|nr:DUF4184 family protein [Blastococcus sp. DSM 46838]SFF59467.1 protein of unknown function [Blastococcus sp. DSM 46838]